MPDYCSADVFTGRHISSYNMVQFECLSTCVQCSHCSCITLWHVVMPPIARGQTGYANPCRCQLCQTLGGIYLIVPIEDSMKKKSDLIVQGYGNVISMQFTGSYYRCYTVVRVPAILRHCFVDSLEIYTLTLCLADLCQRIYSVTKKDSSAPSLKWRDGGATLWRKINASQSQQQLGQLLWLRHQNKVESGRAMGKYVLRLTATTALEHARGWRSSRFGKTKKGMHILLNLLVTQQALFDWAIMWIRRVRWL